jgi:hypothetical protein
MKIPMVVAIVATTVALPAIAHAEPAPTCADGQVQVTNAGEQRGLGHRSVILKFSLAPGTAACTLTGYPGVDSGTGGPLVHAERTLWGYMGGLMGLVDTLPVVTVSKSQPAYAMVEGVAVDKDDPYRLCPTYTDLRVTPPDTTETVTVPIHFDTCPLEVHPVISDPSATLTNRRPT